MFVVFLHHLSVRGEEIIDSPMYKSPDPPAPHVEWVFPTGAKDLWLKALQRPEAEFKCKAADAIARAHRQGVVGWEPAIEPLRAALDQADQHPSVRLAAARALVELEARDASASLLQQARTGGNDLRQAIEPALAAWDHRPARAVWLERLREAAPRQGSLVLAIRCLGIVREEQAAEPLRTLIFSNRATPAVRLEAARSLGQLRASGLEKDAARLAADSSPPRRTAHLAAVALLQRHSSPEAIQLMQQLSRDEEHAAAALAIDRLLALDAKLVLPALDPILASPDPKVRALGVEALRLEPTEQRIGLLCNCLDDPHADARAKARRCLHELAGKKELRDRVLAEAMQALGTKQWRTLEQSAILLTELNHKPAAGRLVELLTFERPEVFVTAAWGLRKLAVAETLPAVLRHVEARMRPVREEAKELANETLPDMIDHELSQLNQFLGQQKYAQAEAMLQQFIPKPWVSRLPIGHESRAAAVWALGLIHEGKNLPELAAALEQRLNDIGSIPPEDRRVRWMCAYTLGRMKAKECVASLRRHCPNREPNDDPVNNACGWALEQITGEKMPAPRTIRRVQRDWFLVPVGNAAEQ
jgi:HEAT repeat protein